MRLAARGVFRILGVSAGAAFLSAVGAPGQEAQFLAQEAAGIVPVQGETRLLVRGIRGEIHVKTGKPGEVRFASIETLEKRRQDLPLEVWLEGATIVLTPPEGRTESGRRVLQIGAPPNLDVRFEVAESKIRIAGLQSDLEVQGDRLDVEARGIEGGIHLDVVGSTAVIETVTREVTIRGAQSSLRVAQVGGDLDLQANGGQTDVRTCRGGVRASVEGVVLTLSQIHSPVELRAQGGQASVSDLKRGGEFFLTKTPLKLERAAGEVSVQSDADVEFKDGEAELHLDSYGGSLRGERNKGLVEVRTRHAAIAMTSLQGPTRIQGDGLHVRLENVEGETVIYATGSEVSVDRSAGSLDIENDGGDVRVTGAAGSVQVSSRQGDVRILDSTAPVEVEADGREVEVSWAMLSGDKDSMIRNESGDVTLRFPDAGGCRVEARTRFGRVETDLPNLRVLEDGRSAQGIVGNTRRPTVRVESSGDIFLLVGAAAPREEGS